MQLFDNDLNPYHGEIEVEKIDDMILPKKTLRVKIGNQYRKVQCSSCLRLDNGTCLLKEKTKFYFEICKLYTPSSP